MSGLILNLAWFGAFAGPLLVLLVVLRLGRRALRPLALTGLIASAAIYGVCVWAVLIEPRTLVVREVEVRSARWSGKPLRIGVVSDTHVGAPPMTVARLERIIDRLNQARPDVVVFLGDYAGSHEPASVRSQAENSEILKGATALGRAEAPLGLYAVLGNHDSWYDAVAIERALTKGGVVVLENEAAEVKRPGGSFWIAGLADLESKRLTPSVPEALEAVPADAPVVLLSHWPDLFAEIPGRVALTLAGHSHCGQVNLPLAGRIVHASAASRHWGCGAYDEGGRKLFVTGGLGVSILPVRFRAPPEIVLLTLRGAEDSARTPSRRRPAPPDAH